MLQHELLFSFQIKKYDVKECKIFSCHEKGIDMFFLRNIPTY